jgi:hypothetical protein
MAAAIRGAANGTSCGPIGIDKKVMGSLHCKID